MKQKSLIKYLSVIFILAILVMLPSVASSENTAEPQSKNFRDDFTGQKKRPEWRIDREDKDRYTFVDNEYLLLVTKNPSVNKFIYDTTDLPENFEVTIGVKNYLRENYQGFSLLLEQDNKNHLELYMSVDPSGDGYISTFFTKKLRDENSKYKKGLGHLYELSNNSSLLLRIRKKGIEYTGLYSIGGGAWKEVGTHIFLNLKGKLSFYTYNSRKSVPESAVKVDYFEIKELD